MVLDELSNRVAGELAERGLLDAAADARVSAAPDARTVRYYTTLGLLDRPKIEGRQARYGERHVLQLLYARSDAELKRLVEGLSTEAREHAAACQRENPVPTLRLREVAVEPGICLIVEEGWKPRDPAALEAKIRAALAALGGER